MTRSYLFAAALFSALACSRMAPAQIDVSLTRVGDPIWKASQVHLFSAPAETDEEWLAVVNSIRDFYSCSTTFSDTTMDEAVAAAGYMDESVYPTTAIDGQNMGAYLVFALRPDPGIIGSHRCGGTAPIIPNSILPIVGEGELRRDGVFVDGGSLPPFTASPNYDGAVFHDSIHENDANFWPPGTPLVGNWEWNMTLRDQNGNGWDIAVPFQVVPEPSTVALAVVGLGGCLVLGRHRRRQR